MGPPAAAAFAAACRALLVAVAVAAGVRGLAAALVAAGVAGGAARGAAAAAAGAPPGVRRLPRRFLSAARLRIPNMGPSLSCGSGPRRDAEATADTPAPDAPHISPYLPGCSGGARGSRRSAPSPAGHRAGRWGQGAVGRVRRRPPDGAKTARGHQPARCCFCSSPASEKSFEEKRDGSSTALRPAPRHGGVRAADAPRGARDLLAVHLDGGLVPAHPTVTRSGEIAPHGDEARRRGRPEGGRVCGGRGPRQRARGHGEGR